MVFRRRFTDNERGFTGYFWKAIPQPQAQSQPQSQSASTEAAAGKEAQ